MVGAPSSFEISDTKNNWFEMGLVYFTVFLLIIAKA